VRKGKTLQGRLQGVGPYIRQVSDKAFRQPDAGGYRDAGGEYSGRIEYKKAERDRMLNKLKDKIGTLRPKKVYSPKLYRPPYADIHKGRDFLVFATGPSVEKHKREILDFIEREKPVTIGCNNSCRIYAADYHGFSNRRRFTESAPFIDIEKTKVMISPYIAPWVIKKYFKGMYWPLMFANSKKKDIEIKDGVISASYVTSAVVMAAVAMVMGANRVYIAGLDGYSEYLKERRKLNCLDVVTKHGSFEGDEKHYLNLERQNNFYLERLDKYIFSASGNHIKIITPTVHKKYYDERILNLI
jgi:hypothetical protein